MLAFTGLAIGQGLWVFFGNYVGEAGKWLGLTLAILALLIFISIFLLTAFHIYISFFLYQTTLQFLRNEAGSQSQKQRIITIGE